jgi:hypothetical protein
MGREALTDEWLAGRGVEMDSRVYTEYKVASWLI